MKIKFVNQDTGDTSLERVLNPSQEKFWNSDKKFIVLNGGFRSGKTEIVLLKTLYDAVSQDNNYILMGRKTYQEIYDVLLKDFLDLCPPNLIKDYKKSPHPTIVLYTLNGKTSTLIFRNLDKLAEAEIKGLNLGQIVIDQAEDIEEGIFRALTFRLSRKGIAHRVYLTSNPALNWLFRKVKQETDHDWELIEVSARENYKNLPRETVELYESFKESDPTYYKQYVEGIWDESLLADNTAFSRDLIEKMRPEQPIKFLDGLAIFKEPIKGHCYQIGGDPSEGVAGGDDAAVCISDMDTLEEVASFAGKIPPEELAERCVYWAKHYSSYPLAMIIPEMNAMGLAFLNKLKELGWQRIYQREEYDKKSGRLLEKLGWRTTVQTKPLLISNFRHLLRNFPLKIRSKETIEQFKTFIFTDEAKKKGAGAQSGFHDDRVMATLLAFWEKKRRPGGFIKKIEELNILNTQEIVPSLEVVNGKLQWKGLEIKQNKWTIS